MAALERGQRGRGREPAVGEGEPEERARLQGGADDQEPLLPERPPISLRQRWAFLTSWLDEAAVMDALEAAETLAGEGVECDEQVEVEAVARPHGA